MEKANTIKQISLDCGSGCCPVVTFMDDGTLHLADDFGGTVKLTNEQALRFAREVIQSTSEQK